MSRSPRKLVSRAVDALREMDEVLARYPDAEAGVRAILGVEGLAEVHQARDILERAAERLTAATRASAGPGKGTEGSTGESGQDPSAR